MAKPHCKVRGEAWLGVKGTQWALECTALGSLVLWVCGWGGGQEIPGDVVEEVGKTSWVCPGGESEAGRGQGKPPGHRDPDLGILTAALGKVQAAPSSSPGGAPQEQQPQAWQCSGGCLPWGWDHLQLSSPSATSGATSG